MTDYKPSPEVKAGLKKLQADVKKNYNFEGIDIQRALDWTAEELQELREGIEKEDRENTKQELTQLLIWCFSMAIILDIDVSKTVEQEVNYHINKYPKSKS